MTSEKSQLIGGQTWFTFDRRRAESLLPPGWLDASKYDDVLILSIASLLRENVQTPIIHSTDNLLRLHAQVSATLSPVQRRETSTRFIFCTIIFLPEFFPHLLRDGRKSRRCWRTSSRSAGGRWASSGSWPPGPGQSRGRRLGRASCWRAPACLLWGSDSRVEKLKMKSEYYIQRSVIAGAVIRRYFMSALVRHL